METYLVQPPVSRLMGPAPRRRLCHPRGGQAEVKQSTAVACCALGFVSLLADGDPGPPTFSPGERLPVEFVLTPITQASADLRWALGLV